MKMQMQKTSLVNRNHGAVKRTNQDTSPRFIQQVCLWPTVVVAGYVRADISWVL
jgi:hypothetical protein